MNEETKQEDAAPKDTFEDIEPHFRPVAQKHGRALFAAVMLAGMGRQAVVVLMALSEKHRSRYGANATMQLGSSVEQLVNALAVEKGWTAEVLAQVDKDIQDAWAKRDTGRVMLIH
jgi:hypothetical protein